MLLRLRSQRKPRNMILFLKRTLVVVVLVLTSLGLFAMPAGAIPSGGYVVPWQGYYEAPPDASGVAFCLSTPSQYVITAITGKITIFDTPNTDYVKIRTASGTVLWQKYTSGTSTYDVLLTNLNISYVEVITNSHIDADLQFFVGADVASEASVNNAVNAANAAKTEAINAKNAANTAATNALNAYNAANNAYSQLTNSTYGLSAIKSKVDSTYTVANNAATYANNAAAWTWDSAESKSAATLAKEARDKANQALTEINTVKNEINTVKNMVNNIQSSVGPQILKVRGLNGATATRTNTFTVTVEAANATEFRARADGGSWSGWTPVSSPLTLAGFDAYGAHTVYVEVRNASGATATGQMTAFRL